MVGASSNSESSHGGAAASGSAAGSAISAEAAAADGGTAHTRCRCRCRTCACAEGRVGEMQAKSTSSSSTCACLRLNVDGFVGSYDVQWKATGTRSVGTYKSSSGRRGDGDGVAASALAPAGPHHKGRRSGSGAAAGRRGEQEGGGSDGGGEQGKPDGSLPSRPAPFDCDSIGQWEEGASGWLAFDHSPCQMMCRWERSLLDTTRQRAIGVGVATHIDTHDPSTIR